MEPILPWYVYLIECADSTLYCDVGKSSKTLKNFVYLRSRAPYTIVKKRKYNRLSDAVVKCLEVRKLKKEQKLKGMTK